MSFPMDRQHLEEKLGEIKASLPLLLANSDDPRDFWSAFADEANHLSLHMEAPEDEDYARACLNRMLQEMGLIAKHEQNGSDRQSASFAM